MKINIKTTLGIAGICLILILALTAYFERQQRIRERQRADRLEENQRQYLQDSLRYAKLTLSLQEFKTTMTRKVDSILNAARIKPKQVTSVVERHFYYHNKDTVLYQPNQVVTDTGSLYPFSDYRDCFHFAGFMQIEGNKPELTVTLREFNNSSIDIAYLERPHKFLFFKWGKWRAKLKSTHQCGEETTKEIEIIK